MVIESEKKKRNHQVKNSSVASSLEALSEFSSDGFSDLDNTWVFKKKKRYEHIHSVIPPNVFYDV